MRFDFLRCIQISAILLFIHFNAQNVFCESINVKNSLAYEEAAGVTHVVSPDPDTGFTTIEQTINTAETGGTVWIKDGVYHENIVLKDQVIESKTEGYFR